MIGGVMYKFYLDDGEYKFYYFYYGKDMFLVQCEGQLVEQW